MGDSFNFNDFSRGDLPGYNAEENERYFVTSTGTTDGERLTTEGTTEGTTDTSIQPEGTTTENAAESEPTQTELVEPTATEPEPEPVQVRIEQEQFDTLTTQHEDIATSIENIELTSTGGTSTTSTWTESQVNELLTKLDSIITGMSETMAYVYYGFTVIIPLIAVVCLLWWFVKQFLWR